MKDVFQSPFLDLASQLVVLDTASLAFMAAYYVFISADPRLRESSYSLVGATALLTISTLTSAASVGLNVLGWNTAVSVLAILSGLSFLIAWIMFFFAMMHSFARVFYLRDRRYIKYFWVLRKIKDRNISSYVKQLAPRLAIPNTLIPFPSQAVGDPADGFSLLIIANCPMPVARSHAARILTQGIKANETANYVCAEISPLTAFEHFDLNDSSIDFRSLVFIDGFTPHYGYYDEVVISAQRTVREQGPGLVPAFTISGVHSAGNTAWHLAREHQKQSGNNDRRPNRMVYDCISALTPYSSDALVRAFITHTINSEKLYGMVSVYIERPDSDLLNHLSSLVDGVAEIKEAHGSYGLTLNKWKSCKSSELGLTIAL